MKFRLWSVLLKAAALRHRDAEHRTQLLLLSEELGALDRATPGPRPRP